MRVTIRTPEAEVFTAEASSVSLVTELGAAQIFSGHASLQGVIVLSPVRIELAGVEENFVLQRGFVVVDQTHDEVTLLGARCERRETLDLETAEAYLQVLLQALKNHESLGHYQLRHLEDEHLATTRYLEVLRTNGRPE